MGNELSIKGKILLNNHKNAIRMHDAGPSMDTLQRYKDTYKNLYVYIAALESELAELQEDGMALTDVMKISCRDATINALKEEISGLNTHRRMQTDRIKALEAENAALKAKANENDDQLDGYRRLCNGLSELVVDVDAGDGFYCNDPVEMLVDVRDTYDQLRSELAELREAASQVYNRYCKGTEYTNEDEKWKRTLRALLKHKE